ncbi:putative cytokinetic ring protein SteA [Paenibacillus sp. MBLB4367]|uniref:putative cytokinetic ring protein SteA n=1 Tax=Paenibacillus sp. MBLB4367 TaxID=3384767 RepID=UPI003907FADC
MAVINQQGEIFPLSGIIRAGKVTKELLRRSAANEVLVIAHRDLDETAAIQLLEARPKAVVNAAASLSGAFPAKGALHLLKAGVPLLEVPADAFDKFQDGGSVEIDRHEIRLGGCAITYHAVTLDRCARVYERSAARMDKLLLGFVANTLAYAELELPAVVKTHESPPLLTPMTGRPVVVVSRGNGALADLLALGDFIRERKPALIGVDGGADLLRKAGYSPDVIVGDMDSVSDRCLLSGSELVVHAYTDGTSPGQSRVRALGQPAYEMRSPGTSEDMALLLAHGAGAELIVTVGLHTHMLEFLEKGRSGMGSTLLVRMLLGGKLIDAKGISVLFKQKKRGPLCDRPLP